MTIPALRYWRRKTLLAKIETTAGTDASPTGGANAIRAFDVALSPMEGQDIERPKVSAFFGAQETIAVDLHVKLSFKVEAAASGAAGVAPAWGPLLRACRPSETIVADTSVTYAPTSAAFESASIYINIDGTNHKMLMSRGNAKIGFTASGIPVITFEMTGLFTAPAAATLPSTDYSAFERSLIPNKDVTTLTIAGGDIGIKSFELDLGNQVVPRFLINDASVEITDAMEKLTLQIEAPALATFNPFALAQSGATVAMVLTHGTVAGAIITLTLPTVQLQRPGPPSETNGIVMQQLMGAPTFTDGNDQWSLALT